MSGRKRAYRDAYPRPDTKAPLPPPLTEGVKLELVRMGSPAPNYPYLIRSFVADFARSTGVAVASEYIELRGVAIDVFGAERTLVDKLSLLHDVAVRATQDDADALTMFRNKARHYYVVHQLLSQQSVLRFVQALPGGMAAVSAQAFDESAAARRTKIGKRSPEDGLAVSPAFTVDSPVHEVARAAYEAEVPSLVYAAVPTFGEVIARARQNAVYL